MDGALNAHMLMKEDLGRVDQVLAKLDLMSVKLDELLSRQQQVEGYVKGLSQEVGSLKPDEFNRLASPGGTPSAQDSPWRRFPSGAADAELISLTSHPISARQNRVRAVRVGRRVVATTLRSSEPSTPQIQDEAKEGEPFPEEAEALEMGFWPREEIMKMKTDEASRRNTRFGLHLRRSGTTIAGYSEEKKTWQLQPLHPESWKRAHFDCVSLIILLFDSIMIPYQLAWDLPYMGWLAVVSWLTCLFWVVDLLLGFMTGYYRQDEVIMGFRPIARRYITSGRFFLSLLVVLADLGGNIIETFEIGSGLQSAKTLVKLTRFIKLERVRKLTLVLQQGKVAQALDALHTFMRLKGLHEQFNLSMRVCKLVFYILWVNHLGGCLWFMIGKTAFTEFVDEINAEPAETSSRRFQYMLSFYWSASIFVSGGSIMNPRTTLELIMTVCCVVFGFIFTSVLISSLLTAVIEYQESNKERSNKLTILRQFLYQHHVDVKLSVPLVKQAKVRMDRSKMLPEGDVEALSLLSHPMRAELWFQIYGPSLKDYPLFSGLAFMEKRLIQDICSGALAQVALEPGQRLFHPKEEAHAAYFVYAGSLDYTILNEAGFPTFKDSRQSSTVASRGTWICEAALWAHWLHRGSLDARSKCQLLSIQAEGLVKVMTKHPHLVGCVKAYSQCLLSALKLEPAESLTDLSLPVSHHSVVAAMPLPQRVEMSQSVVLDMVHSGKWSGALSEHTGFGELKAEVDVGDCDLMPWPDGGVRRIVTIVALSLERRSDRMVLTQIGKVSDGKRIGSCQPPGTKVKVGEHSRHAIERLIKQKLTQLVDFIDVGGSSNDSEERVSKKYGVPSMYMRTLYTGVFDASDTEYVKVVPRKHGSTGVQPLAKFASTKGVERRASAASEAMPSSAVSSVLAGFMSTAADPTQGYEAFVFRSELAKAPSTLFLYAWLRPEDFEALQGGHEDLLQKWVDELELDSITEQEDRVTEQEDHNHIAEQQDRIARQEDHVVGREARVTEQDHVPEQEHRCRRSHTFV